MALYLLQCLKVHFPAASYPPPSSSNFSRHASLASTLPLLLWLFTSNTSRCASLLLVSVQFLMGTIYLFHPSCSLQDHLRWHIFRQVLAYHQSRQFALWEINQMECEMCFILEGQLNVDPSTLCNFRSHVHHNFAGGPYLMVCFFSISPLSPHAYHFAAIHLCHHVPYLPCCPLASSYAVTHPVTS